MVVAAGGKGITPVLSVWIWILMSILITESKSTAAPDSVSGTGTTKATQKNQNVPTKFQVEHINRTEATLPSILHKTNSIFYTSFIPVIFKVPMPTFSKYTSLHAIMCGNDTDTITGTGTGPTDQTQSNVNKTRKSKTLATKLTYEEQACMTLKNLSRIFESIQSNSFLPLPHVNSEQGHDLPVPNQNTSSDSDNLDLSLISCNEIYPHFQSLNFKISQHTFNLYQDRLKECFFAESVLNFPLQGSPSVAEFDKLLQSAMNESFSPNRLYSSVLQDIAVNSYLFMQQSSILNLQIVRSKWSEAFSACSSQLIPSSFINHETLLLALKVVEETIEMKKFKLALQENQNSKNSLLSYYNLPLTDCVVMEGNLFVIRVLVPLLKTEENFNLVRVVTTPHVMSLFMPKSTASAVNTVQTAAPVPRNQQTPSEPVPEPEPEHKTKSRNSYTTFTTTENNYLICEPNSVQEAKIMSSVQISEHSRHVSFSKKRCTSNNLCFLGEGDDDFYVNDCLMAAYENEIASGENQVLIFPTKTTASILNSASASNFCQTQCNQISGDLLPLARRISSSRVAVAGSLGTKVLVVCDKSKSKSDNKDDDGIIPEVAVEQGHWHWIEFNVTETIEIELPCNCQLEYGFSASVLRPLSPCDSQTRVISVYHLNLEVDLDDPGVGVGVGVAGHSENFEKLIKHDPTPTPASSRSPSKTEFDGNPNATRNSTEIRNTGDDDPAKNSLIILDNGGSHHVNYTTVPVPIPAVPVVPESGAVTTRTGTEQPSAVENVVSPNVQSEMDIIKNGHEDNNVIETGLLKDITSIQTELKIMWIVVSVLSFFVLSILVGVIIFAVRFKRMRRLWMRTCDHRSTFYSFSDLPILS